MKTQKILIGVVIVLALAVILWYFFDNRGPAVNSTGLLLPEGLKIEVVASGLQKPRVIVFDPKGRMLVSELDANRVSILEKGADGALLKRVLVEKLRSPHGLAFYENKKKKITYLYIAEAHQVARYVYDLEKGTVDLGTSENIATFSADGRHITRTIGFGPNFRVKPIIAGYIEDKTQVANKLYISVGSSCDVCVETSWKRGAILEADPEGTFLAEFAGGLRNSVFFAFHPYTAEIWATEMGRDNLGDDLPPDEINIVKVAGVETPFGARRYGWPFCYGSQVKDATFNPAKVDRIDIPSDCTKTESPIIEIPAHSAPLGLAFIPSLNGWPNQWKGDLLVAYHGSWNRSEPAGYKIVRFDLDEKGKLLQPKNQDGADFVTGFYDGKKVTGRPVDLKFGPDGALYVSDDEAGLIYRISPK